MVHSLQRVEEERFETAGSFEVLNGNREVTLGFVDPKTLKAVKDDKGRITLAAGEEETPVFPEHTPDKTIPIVVHDGETGVDLSDLTLGELVEIIKRNEYPPAQADDLLFRFIQLTNKEEGREGDPGYAFVNHLSELFHLYSSPVKQEIPEVEEALTDDNEPLTDQELFALIKDDIARVNQQMRQGLVPDSGFRFTNIGAKPNGRNEDSVRQGALVADYYSKSGWVPMRSKTGDLVICHPAKLN